MARLSLSLLGPYLVTLAGEPITDFATDKVRALLAYLAVEGHHPHRRDTLAGLIWPDQPQQRARHNLRQALSHLRQAVGDPEGPGVEPFLLVTRQTVQFNTASDHWLDVATFGTLSQDCQTHSHRRLETCIPCVQRMDRMVELYRGPFLAQFFLSDSSTFEEWAVLRREWLHRQVVEALSHLIDFCERRGDYAQARRYAWRQVALEPWREEAHRHLMRLLALDGQRSAALAQYQTCQQALANELGIEPTHETTALYEQIRVQSHAELPLGARTPTHNLPPSPTPFVGRDAELAEVADLLANPDCRLLTVFGPGGIGKTRLAIQAASDQLGAFRDGVTFVPLNTISSIEHLVPAISDALGIPPYTAPDPKAQLFNYLREKELLLVIDSMEHLLDGCNLLSEILTYAPGLLLLVTSRERLNLHEEWVYKVGGLAYPADELEEGTASYSAIDLFIQCARRVDQRFSPGETDTPHILRICRLVEGMPLGIELAAAWVAVRSCEDIAHEIEHNLNIQATRLRNVPSRHRSIWATFEHSWQLLQEPEQLLLARLSIFRGGFQRAAAADVAEAPSSILLALLDKSLIRRTSSNRYNMHEMLRQYAAEKLQADPPEYERIQQQYTQHYAAFLEERGKRCRGTDQKQALTDISLEIENARQTWHLAVTSDRIDQVDQSLEGLYHFYDVQCRFQEGIDLFAQAIERWPQEVKHSSALSRVLPRVLSRQGALYRRLGRYEQARTILQRSLTLFERLGAPTEQIFCLVNLTDVLHRHGQSDEALQMAEKSLTASRQARDQWGIVRSLSLLGLLRYRTGDLNQAEALLEESLALGRESGNHRLIAGPLNLLGDIVCHRGDYARALRVFEQCLALSRELEDQYNVAMHLNNLGTVLHILGKYTEARSMYQESLDICRQIGDRGGQAIALSNLGEVAYALDRYLESRDYCLEALSIGHSTQDQWTIMACLNSLGEIAYITADCEEAEVHFIRALKIATETQTLTVVLKVLVNLAVLFAGQGQPDRAALLLELARRHPACEQADQEKAERALDEMGLTPPKALSESLDTVVSAILATASSP